MAEINTLPMDEEPIKINDLFSVPSHFNQKMDRFSIKYGFN